MRQRRTSVGGLALGLVVAVAVLALNWRYLERQQVEDQLNRALDNKDIPPTLAFTTQAVGPLRGLITNALWWRTLRLQDDGNYFEAIQLADWISSLQPRLTRVWTWQSWNMAYNISATIDDREERWKWITEGIKLLRDKGLRYNPRDALISTELAQTFMQKVGHDPEHARYYQTCWAQLMRRYLRDGNRAELEALATAPDTVAELRQRPGVAALLAAGAAAGVDLLSRDASPPASGQPVAAASRLLQEPQHRAAAEEVRLYLAKKGLRADLNLDPVHMLAIDREYGPLDWRLYQAHVLYWGASESYDPPPGEEQYQHPYVRQALVEAVYDGQLLFIDDRGLSTGPNLEIIHTTHEYLAKYLKANPGNAGAIGLNREFHEWAILLLYTQMYREEAAELFDDYRDNFMSKEERQQWDFESFVLNRAPQLLQASGRAGTAQAMVMSSLQQAYVWAAKGDNYRAKGFESLATVVWQRHQLRFADNPDKQLPKLDELKRNVLAFMLSNESTAPPDVKAALRQLKGDAELPALLEPGSRPALKVGGSELHGHD